MAMSRTKTASNHAGRRGQRADGQETNHPRIEQHYKKVLDHFIKSKIPFMVGGAYAMREYGDIYRETKDLDVFCKPGDYPQLLKILSKIGYKAIITDPNWIAKGLKPEVMIDLIFGAGNRLTVVDDSWFDNARRIDLLGYQALVIGPEEVIFSKMFVRERDRYDGADINHVIRKYGSRLNWRRLLTRADAYWELFFSMVMEYRFVYPSEASIIPDWLLQELLGRLNASREIPKPFERVSRGLALAPTQYRIDYMQWGYKI